jgi:DDE superfamily endonuclease
VVRELKIPGSRKPVWPSSGTRSRSEKSLRATEQERTDVARARRRWMREQGLFDPARLVFIDDETSANTKMVRLYGRCVRGKRLVDLEPQGHWKTITFVAALRQNGMTAPCTIDGAMNGKRFVAYAEAPVWSCTHASALCCALQCARRWARPVRHGQPLRHDALQTHDAGLPEDGGAILVVGR